MIVRIPDAVDGACGTGVCGLEAMGIARGTVGVASA
jgi:hypothetical protein